MPFEREGMPHAACGRQSRVNKRVVARACERANREAAARPFSLRLPLSARLTAALPIVVGVFLDYVPRHLAAPIERPTDRTSERTNRLL